MAEQRTGSDGSRALEAPLVAIGAILLVAGLVGGAVEGAGVKVPLIAGSGRQLVAGLVGGLMLVVGLSSRWWPIMRDRVVAISAWSERRRLARTAPRPDVGVAPTATEHLVGREEDLSLLQQELAQKRRVVLRGLGGVGKTQLAIHYLRRRRTKYRQGIFWLRGDDASEFEGDLVQVAEYLGLPQRGLQAPEVADGVRRWLGKHDRWLIVVDNLDGDVDELLDRRLPPDLPGHVLITSQRRLLGAHDHPLRTLTLDAATELLRRRAPQSDGALARTVADRLDCLPLPLEQAAAYLEQTGEQLAIYAELLESNLSGLLAAGAVANHPRSVVATWKISFDRIAKRSMASADLLRLCAFLSPDAIPLRLLLEHAADVLPPASPLVAEIGDRDHLNQTLAPLLDYALLSREGDRLTLHRLSQAVLRDSLGGSDRELWAGSAVRMLVAGFPTAVAEPTNWPACQELLSHALMAAEHTIQSKAGLLEAASLLNAAGEYGWRRGEYSVARPIFERALAIRERMLGRDHPDTAASLNQLALLLQAQGELATARSLFEEALAIRERELRPGGLVNIGESLNNLAGLLQAQGELATARRLLERGMAIIERLRGSDDADTATGLNNLAGLLWDQGDLATARTLFERALAIQKRVLGPDHPNTAGTVNNLAGLLQAQGELATARSLFEEALAIRQRVLGPDHPETAASLNNLGLLLQAQGELATAEALYERALDTWERVLGPDHPNTATSLNNIASLLLERGELASARALFERALAIRELKLGPDHPDTATNLSMMGHLLLKQGEVAAAKRLFERALAVRELVLGADHPDTLMARDGVDECVRRQRLEPPASG